MKNFALLAEEAVFAVSDLLDEDGWDIFDALSPVEKVQFRYCHADCDDFALALSEITGWPIKGVSGSQGPIHRLVQAPDGRFVDATGWTDLEKLQVRYKVKRLSLSKEGAQVCDSSLNDAEDFSDIIEALLQLPVEPFTDDDFCEKVRAFARSLAVI